MWIRASGEISQGVVQITTATSSHFVFIGERSALVDAGVAAMRERLMDDLARHLTIVPRLDYILLTHAHFDHLGMVPQLRQRYPDLKLVVGVDTARQLSSEEYRSYTYKRNCEVAEAFTRGVGLNLSEWLAALVPDMIIGEGDEVDLGADMTLKLISTPGHTEDSVSYYCPRESALVPGEAVGSYNGRDKLAACFEWSYRDYLLSLEKLQKLQVNYLSLPHAGALSGDIARKFLSESKRTAEAFASAVRQRLLDGETFEQIRNSLIVEWTSSNVCPDGPFVEDQERIISSMVRIAAENR